MAAPPSFWKGSNPVSQAPAPPQNPETQRYFDALADGKLLIKNCPQCGQTHFYPRAGCPFCFHDSTEWLESSGSGTLYAYSVLRAAKELPVLAYVTLAEGPTLMTSIVDSPLEELTPGAPVQLVVRTGADGIPAPMFTLI
jgi:uncharacterized OB-fold protein